MNIAILASGNGSNAEQITRYFSSHASIKVAAILTNNPNAGVIKRAESLNVPCILFSTADLTDGALMLTLESLTIELLVLAGFLLKIPSDLIRKYPHRIINLHPALLPDFGGKGMYGMRVHAAVIAARSLESGITIHLVNEAYDKGRILFQKRIKIKPGESPEELAERIHALEYEYFPLVLEDYIYQLA